MTQKVTLRETRVFLEGVRNEGILLTLKACANQGIFKFQNFWWNPICRRWEYKEDICLHVSPSAIVEIEIYDARAADSGSVIGETSFTMTPLPPSFSSETKLCLTFDGLVVGWLYCELELGNNTTARAEHYLYIHKLALSFMEEQETCNATIYLNNSEIFHKQIFLNNNSRTLYPNIKHLVKKSDNLTFLVATQQQTLKSINFLIDHIKTGETTILNVWTKNKRNQKQGQLSLEYFLDNLYLQNDPKVFTRKIEKQKRTYFFPQKISVGSTSTKTIEQKNNQDCQRRKRQIKRTILASIRLKIDDSRGQKQLSPKHFQLKRSLKENVKKLEQS